MRSWPLHEQIAFFERELGLPLVEETESGKLFPKSQSARDVRDTLLAHARRKGVTIVTDTLVTGVRRSADRWIVERHEGDPLEADAVVLATGGLSVPNTGSDGRGLQIAEALGHAVNPTYAGADAADRESGGRRTLPSPFAHLSGVSLTVTITARSGAREAQATGGFLFTHQGYSGPSVLDVSHVAVRSLADEGRAREDHRPVDAAARQRLGRRRCVRAPRARCSPRSAPNCPTALPTRSSQPPASSPAARSRNSAAPSGCD